MREGGGAWRWTCDRRRRCLQGGPATWGNGFGRRGAPVQHGSPPPGGLHGLQEGGAGSRGQGRGTARRRAPGTGQIWRGEADQRQTGSVRILLAALPFVHGGPLSKGNEQRDEQRERKTEREKKGKGNGGKETAARGSGLVQCHAGRRAPDPPDRVEARGAMDVVGGYRVEAERNFGLGARASGTRRRESAGWVEKDREGIPRGFGRVAAEGTGGWDKAPRI